jgi:Na+/H+-dicarboxylate symporter
LQPPNAADISWKTWLLSLVPVNPIKAAADGALLPLIVFTVAFAFALTRLDPQRRSYMLRLFEATTETLLIVVRWVLLLTPVGVFALSFVVAARAGAGTLGAALGYYVGLAVLLAIVAGAGLYLFAVVAGGVGLRTFDRALFPAQVVGFTSRSSLTALPALIEGARDGLRLPAEVTGFVLPLAISVFKFTSPIYWTLGAQFVGKLYGVDLAPSQLATIAAASILLNASTPGIPSGGLLIQTPIYAAVGLPVEGIAILIGIDAIPDMFKSAVILASDMTVAVVVARWNRSAGAVAGAGGGQPSP